VFDPNSVAPDPFIVVTDEPVEADMSNVPLFAKALENEIEPVVNLRVAPDAIVVAPV